MQTGTANETLSVAGIYKDLRYNTMNEANYQQRAPKININDLTPGDIIRLRGKVAWSHIGYLYEGAELDAENERRNKFSRYKTKYGPHTRLSLSNVEIIETNPVPGQPGLFAQYMQQHIWTSPGKPELGYQYGAVSRKKTLPEIFVQTDPNQSQVTQITLTPREQELAIGLDVTIILRVFESKDFGNNGISFDQVIINEEPRFYRPNASANNSAAILANFGLTVNNNPTPAPMPAPAPAPQPSIQAPVPPAPMPAPTPVVAPPQQPNFGGINYDPANDPSRNY